MHRLFKALTDCVNHVSREQELRRSRKLNKLAALARELHGRAAAKPGGR